MKKLLLALLSFELIANTTTNFVVSCSIDKDPFHHLPSKHSSVYSWFTQNNINIIGYFNKKTNKFDIDYSPLLMAGVIGSNGDFAYDDYSAVSKQFVDELTIFDHFNKTNNEKNIEYKLNPTKGDISTRLSYEIKKDPLLENGPSTTYYLDQIVRVQNYSIKPIINKNGDNSLIFNIILKKWIFIDTNINDKIGYYKETNNKDEMKLYLNDVTLEELDSSAIIKT